MIKYKKIKKIFFWNVAFFRECISACFVVVLCPRSAMFAARLHPANTSESLGGN